MNNPGTSSTATALVSQMAKGLKGSEIIKLAGEIKELQAAGHEVFNFTIGDFDPDIFPIPSELSAAIREAYNEGSTNYPTSNGMAELRSVLADFIAHEMGLSYTPDQFLVAGGGRPLIYGFYQAVLDKDEEVIFPTPSWNNNHYTHLSYGRPRAIETLAKNNFMPTAEQLRPYIEQAGIVALCSPLNPTGTVFGREALSDICLMILEENARRSKHGRKPLYLLYDQIYWQLTFGNTVHHNPVSLHPEMRPYTVCVDGISKAYAATGIRVGWAFGPDTIIGKMKSILGHLGAWAPKPEQVGTAKFMADKAAGKAYMAGMREQLIERLRGFYRGFMALKEEHLPVDAIAPQAAMYLTVKMDLKGMTCQDGSRLEKQKDVTDYLLKHGGVALVPFSAFGANEESPWYRLSVGTAKVEEIETVMEKIRKTITELS